MRTRIRIEMRHTVWPTFRMALKRLLAVALGSGILCGLIAIVDAGMKLIVGTIM